MARTYTFLLAGTRECCADIEYATGFPAPDPVVFADSDKGGVLVVPGMECSRARRAVHAHRRQTGRHTAIEVFSPDDLGLRRASRKKLSAWARAALRRLGRRRAHVAPAFPLGTARALERAGIRVVLHKGPLYPGRAVKKPYEVAAIRDTQRAAVIAMRAAINLIRDSEIDASGCLRSRGKPLTAEVLRASIRGVLFQHQCLARDIIVAPGPQAADPHEKGSGPLRAGEAVVMDIFPRHLDHGYWGDLTRTVVKGTPARALTRMYAAVRAAQSAALAAVKPGVTGSTVHRTAMQVFQQRGYRTVKNATRREGFIHGTGHGVGLDIHEAPSLSPDGGRLRKGHVITVEPGLYYPGIGGVRIEDTVLVTANGYRFLASCEKHFEI
ncbi:MAG: aminopeptidase P family protein [Lentisphaerae bacterium]|nr:aminopeptidase P family protein [Lentisphaerota bacterium]